MLSSVILNSNKSIRQFLLLGVFFFFLHSRAQIANYVHNGGFESCKGCDSQTFYGTAYFWGAIDTTKYVGLLLSTQQGFVPNSSYTYQWPKGGRNYFIRLGLWKPSPPNTQRGYPRNKLKQTLQSGHTYCVKFYANLSNQSSYGCDGLGPYFGDTSLDLKVPHMGWNRLRQKPHALWAGIADGARFYFVHSYCVHPGAYPSLVTGTAEYGIPFTCAVGRDNIFAVQFHPEKSAQDGLQLLKNFVAWQP